MANIKLMTVGDACIRFAFLALCFILVTYTCCLAESVRRISIKTPDIRPDHPEQYICVSHRLPMGNLGEYIVGFNPSGSAKRIHHMLLYGCEWPGRFVRDSPAASWDCGEMSVKDANATISFPQGKICDGKSQILYAWAKDAPALKLPNGVGFKIGGIDTSIHYLVLQVHYAHIHDFNNDQSLVDHSGLDLDLKLDDGDSGISRRAGVLLLASYGFVKQGLSQHEISCQLGENVLMHVFKFRTHTHKLGVKVQGWKINQQSSLWQLDSNAKKLIGVGDPQKPQMFYDVKDKGMTLSKGDMVYASCLFNNTVGHEVKIGQTGDDEMCNFYIMYWTEGNRLLRQDSCINYNPSPMASYFSHLFQD